MGEEELAKDDKNLWHKLEEIYILTNERSSLDP